MSFDVLDGGAKEESLEGMTDFIEYIPVRREGSRRGFVADMPEGRVKRGPLFFEQISGGEWGLVAEYFVN
jgi:hypothetical protein